VRFDRASEEEEGIELRRGVKVEGLAARVLFARGFYFREGKRA
jgi:hypothetical protein